MFEITFGGSVVKVIDGDTIEVEVKKTLRLRLLDLWCPETRTKDKVEKRLGLLALETLRQLLEGEDVVFTIPIDQVGKFGDSMSFGRILAHVKTAESEVDIADWMRSIGQGFATRELLAAHLEAEREKQNGDG